MSVYPEYIALKNPITQEIWVGQKCQTVFSIGMTTTVRVTVVNFKFPSIFFLSFFIFKGNSISKSDVSAVNSMFIKLAEMFVSRSFKQLLFFSPSFSCTIHELTRGIFFVSVIRPRNFAFV